MAMVRHREEGAMSGTDERIRQVGLVQSFVARPELGSVFGLAIIVITFMIMTSISGTFSAMWTNPIGIQAWVELAAFVGILAYRGIIIDDCR
jgi:hypothetical protein